MTPEKGNNTRISLKTVSVVVGIVVGFIVIWLSLSDRMDARINNNPKVITMGTQMIDIDRRLTRMELTLDGIARDVKEHKDKAEKDGNR